MKDKCFLREYVSFKNFELNLESEIQIADPKAEPKDESVV